VTGRVFVVMNDAQLIYASWVMAAATVAAALAAIASAQYARKAISDQQKNFDKQLAEYRLTLSSETVLKFQAAFDETNFKKARVAAAQALLNGQDEHAAEDVFDFFDTVGLFVRMGALNGEIAHSVFFHWINLYWRAGKHHIGSKQADTAAVWKDFEFLYSRMCEIEKRKDPNSEDLKTPDSRLRQQLKEEFDLGFQLMTTTLRSGGLVHLCRATAETAGCPIFESDNFYGTRIPTLRQFCHLPRELGY